ncbi:MAG: TetR/AcrR family transcriptional regulator [Acidimicrobiia bacterium]|nr:TetR/AcrR family transcriptional regulator [Acidimicrobiia bacterium]
MRRRIIGAAAGLFSSQGIEKTTMDEIAVAAEVSVATVYNYFGSKNALLLAGVSDDTDAMVQEGAAVLARPGTNPTKAIQRLFRVYLEHFSSWQPALLREVLSASLHRVGGTELTAELAQMDQRLIDQMNELLAGFSTRGRLRPDVDPAEATLLLFSTMVTQLFMYVALDFYDEAMLLEQLNRQVDIAFRGLAPPTTP